MHDQEIDKVLEKARKFIEDNREGKLPPVLEGNFEVDEFGVVTQDPRYHPALNPNGLVWDKEMHSWRYKIPDRFKKG
jgi:hypothetical protein